MFLREELPGRLKKLQPSRFEAVSSCLLEEETLRSNPSGSSGEDPAMELADWAKQERVRFERLVRLIEDCRYFEGFIPEGACPVGKGLLEREEALEQAALKDACTRGEDPGKWRITPEMFYSFRREAAWLGIFREWDCVRGFHAELLDRVIAAAHGSRKKVPAAALIGRDGSGKSVSLRRLGLDLSNQGYDVWWVDEAGHERFVQSGLLQLAERGKDQQFVLIDDAQSLGDLAGDLERFVLKHPSIVLILAGRGLPVDTHRKILKEGTTIYTVDEAADRLSILEKVSEALPAAASLADRLRSRSFDKSRLIRILPVLARGKSNWRNAKELETAFLEIIAEDMGRIGSAMPGLARALIDAAAMNEAGCKIYRRSLIGLADFHQPKDSVPVLLDGFYLNSFWQTVAPLLSYDPGCDAFGFHHGELCRAILQGAKCGLIDAKQVGNAAWIRKTLDTILDRASRRESSQALGALLALHPKALPSRLLVKHMHRLAGSVHASRAFLELMGNESLPLSAKERFEILLKAAPVFPLERSLWAGAWKWIQHQYGEKSQRMEALRGLYEAGCRSYAIQIPLIRLLPPDESRRIAKEWLADRSTHSAVVCESLKALGAEGTGEARRLLEESKDHRVLSRCLDLLGPEADTEAKKLLGKAKDFQLVCRCLDLLGPEAKDEARRLLKESRDYQVICRCLDMLGFEASNEARRLLLKAASPEVVCKCLELLGPRAKDEAQRLLEESRDHQVICKCLDMVGSKAKNEAQRLLEESRDHQVICKCLDLLGSEAKDEAKKLLSKSKDRQVLCKCLDLLGSEAKGEAGRLLQEHTDQSIVCRCLELLGSQARLEARRLLQEAKDKEVLCCCLTVLGKEALPFALERAKEWSSSDPTLLIRCLQLAGSEPEVLPAVEEMLVSWDILPVNLRFSILNIPLENPSKTRRAREVLKNWMKHYRPLVTSALGVFNEDPAGAKKCCSEILRRSQDEILYRHRHRLEEYDGHIIKSLSHPNLRSEAYQAARTMEKSEARTPGFLSSKLHRQVKNLMKGSWTSWSVKDRE